ADAVPRREQRGPRRGRLRLCGIGLRRRGCGRGARGEMRVSLQGARAAEGPDQRRDDQARVPRPTRIVAWAVLLALAAFQAYAHRYVIGPDGVSYLDLSDAVVTGHWSRLLNLYWSPLYPVLIGIG